MAKVPKHRRIKRATVLIKRTRCIRNTKKKPFSPGYQSLKLNNHTLARALSQEKQENQILFTRNVELLATVQELTHVCKNFEHKFKCVLKNAKDAMQMIVAASGQLTTTISLCQEFFSNHNSFYRASTSSAGRRESTKRMSTKSPARGVVKPMVSGHTITKPTINLSRVNMQRLQNANLSIIEEGSSSPNGDLERSVDAGRSRTLPERLPVSTLRNEDDQDHMIVNRRTSRFSGGRLSSRRYSKRNSGRLSGGLTGRLSSRSTDNTELVKSPRVTLQDVSRYLTNNQTINIRSLSENTNGERRLSNVTRIEDSQMSDQSSPENSNNATTIPETRDSYETSDSEEDRENIVHSKKSTSCLKNNKKCFNRKQQNCSMLLESDLIDPLEGPSWLHRSSTETDQDTLMNIAVENNEVSMNEQPDSPISTFNAVNRRSSATYFRVPDLPKNFRKTVTSRLNLEDDYNLRNVSSNMMRNEIDTASSEFPDDDDDHRVNLRFITQRRGPSSRAASNHQFSNTHESKIIDDEDEDDDETLMLNLQSQLRPQQTQTLEQPERLQFDMNELLQLTPLKPLLNMNGRINNELATVDAELEPTVTVQLTQRGPKPVENTDTFSRMSTIKIQQIGLPELPSLSTGKDQETSGHNSQETRMSELTTTRLSSRVELPRLTETLMNLSSENHQQTQFLPTPENSKQSEKRKRVLIKQSELTNSASENTEEDLLVQNKKKPKQRKKCKGKDPCTAKVVLQKLNESQRGSSAADGAKSERKNSDESVSSARSSTLSRPDQSSDSEASTTSCNSKSLRMRPRRQKAPNNLKEPSLSKKLRRQN